MCTSRHFNYLPKVAKMVEYLREKEYLILLYGTLSPAEIIYKGFTRYGNACVLIESVHQLPRENTNSAGKPRNSSICFFTYTRWSNDYSKLVRIIKLSCSLLSARYW